MWDSAQQKGHEYFVFRAYINLTVLLNLMQDIADWC